MPVEVEALPYVEATGALHQRDALGAAICRVFAERLGGYGLREGITAEDAHETTGAHDDRAPNTEVADPETPGGAAGA